MTTFSVPSNRGELTSLGLGSSNTFQVRQLYELAEWFGFETRNKYQISDGSGQLIAFAAEQQKGLLGFLFRMVLGHWRSFSVHIYDNQRRIVFIAEHPFRFFFQRLEVRKSDGGPLGAIQQRFSIFTKRFDVENERGQVIFEVRSPIWKLWTFEFRRAGRVAAAVRKRWSGGLTEVFTDKDNFSVEFAAETNRLEDRALVLASAFFIDLQYFETKAGH